MRSNDAGRRGGILVIRHSILFPGVHMKTGLRIGGIQFTRSELMQLTAFAEHKHIDAATLMTVLDHLGPLLRVAVWRSKQRASSSFAEGEV